MQAPDRGEPYQGASFERTNRTTVIMKKEDDVYPTTLDGVDWRSCYVVSGRADGWRRGLNYRGRARTSAGGGSVPCGRRHRVGGRPDYCDIAETGNDSWRFKSRDDGTRAVSATPASSDAASTIAKTRRQRGLILGSDPSLVQLISLSASWNTEYQDNW